MNRAVWPQSPKQSSMDPSALWAKLRPQMMTSPMMSSVPWGEGPVAHSAHWLWNAMTKDYHTCIVLAQVPLTEVPRAETFINSRVLFLPVLKAEKSKVRCGQIQLSGDSHSPVQDSVLILCLRMVVGRRANQTNVKWGVFAMGFSPIN